MTISRPKIRMGGGGGSTGFRTAGGWAGGEIERRSESPFKGNTSRGLDRNLVDLNG